MSTSGPATRRRGDTLQRAIFDAVLKQLGIVGYGSLTMEGIAAAVRTGKAALYRRWSGIDDLVRDALRSVLPVPGELVPQDNVRADILDLLRCFSTACDVTHGAVFQVLAAEGGAGMTQEVVRSGMTDPIQRMILEALARGAERGEVRPDAVTDRIASVGPAMVIQQVITDGPHVPDDQIVAILDEVVMPLIQC